MPKKKRTISPEHLAKLQAGRAKAQEKKGVLTETKMNEIIAPLFDEVVLDLTKENVVNETDLLERIRRMFDEGHNPDLIKVTSRQMMDILDNSNRLQNYDTYYSPFGEHEIKIIPAKDIHADS